MRNATFWRINRHTLCGLLVLLWLHAPIQAKPAVFAQASAGHLRQLLLLPIEASGITLQTHTVDFGLTHADNSVNLSMDALYQLKNSGNTPVAALLRVTGGETQGSPLAPANLILWSGDQQWPLAPAENNSYTAQVPIDANSRIDLHLGYSINLDGVLPAIVYPANLLGQWSGDPSLRITLIPAASINPDSWLRIEPAGWSYTQPAESDQPGLKWLYDAELPDQPLLFQIIHPNSWQQLSEAQAAATVGAPVQAFTRLGELLRELYTTAVANADDAVLRQRFYAQAVAAYTAGIESAIISSTPAATLHAGLAALYRTRTVEATGVVNVAYATLMAEAASRALETLPADDGRRPELLQWQAEGLMAQLKTARETRNWPAALPLLDTLAGLPPEVADPAFLAESRRAITVQQALQFLEQNNQAAALALAGGDITDATLLPPTAERSLFAAWQITTTITLAATQVELAATPFADRAQAAQAALQGVIDGWQQSETLAAGYTFQWADSATAGADAQGLRLVLSLPPLSGGAPLAQAMPTDVDWVLLQGLLQQLAPQQTQQARLLRQQITLRQPLDLHAAGDQWDAMAANLERQATALEAESAAINATDAEGALRTRIQAANYRNA
ncbi:MAG: hypothetical protein M3Q45_05570, partial [Chloroflexota bacterium]|nr:hypothetical protein [Chloroflexota bacterium]